MTRDETFKVNRLRRRLRRAEEALQKLHAGPRQPETPARLLDAAGAGAYEHSAGFSFGSFSRRFAEVHGYQPEDIPPWPHFEQWYFERFHPEDRTRYRERMAEFLSGRGGLFELEVRFRTRDDFWRWVRLAAVATARDAEGRPRHLAGLAFDVTSIKDIERECESSLELMELIGAANSLAGVLRAATAFLVKLSGCEAVGVRLREGEDFPYCETRGFSAEFVRLESSLCSRDEQGELLRDSTGDPVLDCMCGAVICGRIDPSQPFFTPRGSFWTNSTSRLLASTTEADRQGRTRNRCNGEGYESVALVPLRVAGTSLGLLQFNDHRTGMFTPRGIEHFERLAGALALALAKARAEEALRKNSAVLAAVSEGTANLIYVKDLEGRVLMANPAIRRLTGQSQLAGKSDRELMPNPEDAERGLEHDRRVIETGTTQVFEEIASDAGGGLHTLLFTKSPYRNAYGEVIGVIAIGADITERREAENALRQSGELYRTVLASTSDGIILQADSGRILTWNRAAEQTFGITAEQALQQTSPSREWGTIHEDGAEWPGVDHPSMHTLDTGESCRDVAMGVRRRDGELRWISVNTSPIYAPGYSKPSAVVITFSDITGRKQTEDMLRKSLAEKEVLLREVHHRVKNNLAAIIALLDLQGTAMGGGLQAELLVELRNRIRSISLVHEKLYRAESLARVDFEAYLRALISHLRSSAGFHGLLECAVRTSAAVTLEVAVPCGMVVNELVTNALKHAFPEGKPGSGAGACRIEVALEADNGSYRLTVSDNGVGLPLSVDLQTTRSLGLRLVRMLAGHQLSGEVTIDRSDGTRFEIQFKEPRHPGPDLPGTKPNG